MSVTTPLRRSALHHRLLQAGARMVADRGWERPESFGDVEAERLALRGGVVLADLSAQYLLLAQGEGLSAWFPHIPAVGRVGRVANGGAPARCCRLTADSALLLSPRPLELPAGGPCAHLTDLTSGRAIILVAGPRSMPLLQGVTQLDIRDRSLPDGSCAQTSLAHSPATIVRQDRLDLPAYEILVPRDLGEYVWDALADAGSALGVGFAGDAALNPEE